MAKKECKYGVLCYRTHPDHLKLYSHGKKKEENTEGTDAAAVAENNGTDGEESVKKRKLPSSEKRDETNGNDSATCPDSKRPKDNDVDESVGAEHEKASSSHEIAVEKGKNSSTSADKEQRSASDEDESSDTSSDEEYDRPISIPAALMGTLLDRKTFVNKHYPLRMPDDFYNVWQLAAMLKPSDPLVAFSDGGLTLCGMFDVLAGKLDNEKSTTQDKLIRHCRFYMDPPEFQTVMIGPKVHYGYFRDVCRTDDNDENPSFIICSSPNVADGFGRVDPIADSLACSIKVVLEKKLEEDESNEKLERLLDKMDAVGKELKISLEESKKKINQRKKSIVAKTLHGAGIVVPVKNDIGYRPLPDSDAELRKKLSAVRKCTDEDETNSRLEKIDEIMTYIQFANDECDYGMGYEYGIDLFISGLPLLHGRIKQLLLVAYSLLNRQAFGDILKSHLQHRLTDQRKICQVLFEKE